MGDDADLRARIEARVAARRARAASSGQAGTGDADDEPSEPEAGQPEAAPPRASTDGGTPRVGEGPSDEAAVESTAAGTSARARPRPGPGRRATRQRVADAPRSDGSAGPATGTSRDRPVSLAKSHSSQDKPAADKPTADKPAADKPAAEKHDKDGKDEDRGKRKRTGRNWRRPLLRTLVTLVIAALAVVLLRVFVVQPYYIPSASMEPTLHGCPGCNDDHVLVDKISYRIHGVRVGDIVVFRRPKHVTVPEDVLIKRVVAAGGDKIAMRRGRVYVNGLPLDETYLDKDHSCYAHSPMENFRARRVPKDDVFVMGDNRCNSTDSREFGPIPTSSIIGRAFMIVWPLNRIGFVGG